MLPHLLMTSLVALNTVPNAVQSTDYSCGPASLAAIFQYYGKDTTEQELLKEMKVDKKSGATLKSILQSSQSRGIKARVEENATVEKIEDSMRRGQPVLLLVQAWRPAEKTKPEYKDEWDEGHYLIAIGFDEQNLYFEDSWLTEARGYLSREEFLDRWHGWTDEDKKAQHQAVFFEGLPDGSKAPIDLENAHVN